MARELNIKLYNVFKDFSSVVAEKLQKTNKLTNKKKKKKKNTGLLTFNADAIYKISAF